MNYLFKNFDRILELLSEHLLLVLTSLFIALVISSILSTVLYRFHKMYTPAIVVLGFIYTIPSLALFAFLIPSIGLGFKTAVFALVLYSQMTLVRNMVTAIRGIDPSVIEAARGMGMDKWRITRHIILPLAIPVIIAGIRISTVMMIGIAAIAAYINAGGLGELIFEGLAQDHSGKIVAGTIAVALLSILADIVFRIVESMLNRAAWRKG